MSISEQISALQTDKTNIRNAILTKGGTSASENGFDDFATDIATIPSGEYNITVTDNGDGTMNLAIVDSGPRLPSAYQEVEWIGRAEYTTLDNATACIKPNLTWNDFDKVEITGFRDDYDGSASSGASGIMILATWTSATTRTTPYVSFRDSKSGFYCSGVTGTTNNNYTQAQLRESDYKAFTITLTSHANNGQVEFGSWQDIGFGSRWRTKEQKWYNGNTLLRHLIPCYRKSDNVIGMYDSTNNVFYVNEGNGSLDKGANV